MAHWSATVAILDGRHWHHTSWTLEASSAHHAGRNAILSAKAKLPKRTRVAEVRLTLRRLPDLPKEETHG
jgi:hypothetical protein